MVNAVLGIVHIIDEGKVIDRALDTQLLAVGYGVERWANGPEFLAGAAKSGPACILIGVGRRGPASLEVQQRLPEQGFAFPVIVLAGHGEFAIAVQAMHAGAADVMEMPLDHEKVRKAIATAFTSLLDTTAQFQEQQWANFKISKLTKREREVLDGIASGSRNKAIALALKISTRTVEVHRAHIMTKLHVSHMSDALRVAFKVGLGAEKEWRDNYNAIRGAPTLDN